MVQVAILNDEFYAELEEMLKAHTTSLTVLGALMTLLWLEGSHTVRVAPCRVLGFLGLGFLGIFSGRTGCTIVD